LITRQTTIQTKPDKAQTNKTKQFTHPHVEGTGAGADPADIVERIGLGHLLDVHGDVDGHALHAELCNAPLQAALAHALEDRHDGLPLL
jgi:hypothetical protein